MKIKIKNYNNQNNILNEGEVKKPSAFDLFEANVQYQYILQRKKEALPVSIVFPMGFDKPLRLPTPPEDISNIMASYQNNKARKTKNIGGVMQDPIQTFNMADACCRDAFGNFSEISFEADAEKRKLNRSDIIKSNESYNYEDFPVLNETVVGAGLGVGLALGNLASMGVQAGAGFTAGLAATVGANIALIGAGAYLTGYYGEELFGNVEGGGVSNDKVAAHLNAQTQKMLTPKPADPQQYQDIVEAIGDYVKNIMEACSDVAGILTTDGASKMNELSSFVNQLLNTTSAKANEFIESHSKQIEEEKELERKREKLKLQGDKIKSDNVKRFVVNSLAALASSGTKNFPTDLKLLQQIQQYYENKQNKPEEVELDSALQNGGWLQLKAKYAELKKQTEKNGNQNDIDNAKGESLNINYNNKLNEDDTTMSGISNTEHDAPSKLIIEADKIYNKLLLEFEDRFKKDIFSKIDTKSLPKYEETKQQMQDLIDAADKSINNKIDQITKVSSGETAGSGGLSQAAKVFLMGHPLEANNLREVWSRHLVDLKSRMTNRLAQMTDYRNKTRTLGWTWEVCRTVVPKLLARMLTYRYIYAVLSNKGFFSYDTATMEADKKAFEKDKDIYITEAETKLIWLLNQSNEYTSKGETLLVPDKINGGWTITNNNLSYAYFLITRLSGINNNTKAKIATAEFLSNIKSYISNEDLVKQLLTVITNSLSSSNILLLNSNDPEKFNQLAEIFRMPNDIKNVKAEILDTYQKLVNQRNNISTEREKLVNIAKTLDLVRLNPVKIYQACIKNQGVINELLDKIKMDQIKQDDIKAKVKEIFKDLLKIDDIKDKNYNDITIEKIQSYLPDNKNANDYYASILYIYPTLLKNNNVWDDNGTMLKTMSPEAIMQVCKVVKILLPIEFNGLLAYALEDEMDHDDEKEENNKEKEIVNIFQKIKPYCEEIKNASFNKTTIDTLNGSNPVADNAKKEYIKHYKTVINHISEKYKDLTNKELNIAKLAVIINKIVSYSDKNQYKVVVDILKDIIFEKDNKKFEELNLDEQYNILNNLYISIKSIEDLVEWQELTAAINKLKEFAENSNTYPQLNSNPNNESIIYFNDKQYNIVNNIYVLNEDNNENINNTESSEIEKGINVISKDENKAKEILAILKGEKDNSSSTEQINNEEIIKSLDNMTKIITSFSF